MARDREIPAPFTWAAVAALVFVALVVVLSQCGCSHAKATAKPPAEGPAVFETLTPVQKPCPPPPDIAVPEKWMPTIKARVETDPDSVTTKEALLAALHDAWGDKRLIADLLSALMPYRLPVVAPPPAPPMAPPPI